MPLARLGLRSTKPRANSAGFTLVELMTVVAITGILAAIGVNLVRDHVNVAKANRALSGVQSIRALEEAFRSQTGQYLECSPGSTRWYPMLSPSKTMYEWHQPTHQDYALWSGLGLPREGGTQYGFMVNAGTPATAPSATVLKITDKPTFPTSVVDPWYMIQVKGDIDGDGVPMYGAATSFTGNVYLEHEGE